MGEGGRTRGPAHFRQRDVAAAIRAVRKAGETPARVEIEDGKIVVIIGGSEETAALVGDLKREIDEWEP